MAEQPALHRSLRDDVWIPSVCHMCMNTCHIIIHRISGVAVKIEGNPASPSNEGRLCAKGNSAIMRLYDPNRVRTPLKRTNPEKGVGVDPRWVQIAWEEALDTIAGRMKKVWEEDPRKLVMCHFDLQGFPTSSVWMTAFGSPNLISPGGSFCGDSHHPIVLLTMGAFTAEPDLDHCNYLIMVGSQYGFITQFSPVHKARKMAKARERGMKLVVVDPVCTTAAAKADEWIPIRPGTDAALALAILNVLLNDLAIYDTDFVMKYTNGPYLVGPDGRYVKDEASKKPMIWDPVDEKAKTYDAMDVKDFALEGTHKVGRVVCRPAFQALKDHVKKYTPEMASEITTVPADVIRRMAKEFGEAASIGAEITIDGRELPLRPAAANWFRGAGDHMSGYWAGFSWQLLNLMVGAVDVPGGHLGMNIVGPWWAPREGPDGLLIAADPIIAVTGNVYPPARVTKPETIALKEFYPLAYYTTAPAFLAMSDPGRYGLPYKPEVLIQYQGNIMMSMGDPQVVAEFLRGFSFIVSFAHQIDETVEFADIVLPAAVFLERLDPVVNYPHDQIAAGQAYWYFGVTQPAVEPRFDARHWLEVLLEIGDRIGMRGDYNRVFSAWADLREPYRLEADMKYSWEEISDRWLKSTFGDEHGLEWFKRNGILKWPKKVEEIYPRPFIKPRVPIYLEHAIGAGEDLKRVTESLGVEWDASDYHPTPEWRPCLAFKPESPEHDLFLTNFKLAFHTHSGTANNAWLVEVAERDPYAHRVLINTETAKRKGISDGDVIHLESKAGTKTTGIAKLTEGIHPEVVAVPSNLRHWASGFPLARESRGSIHFNSFLPLTWQHIDALSCSIDNCVRVKVSKE